MFNRSKATPGGRRLRATGGVPGMTEVLLLAAALFVILAPTYVSEALSGVEENAVQPPPALAAAARKLRGTERAKRPAHLAETANANCLISGPLLASEKH